MTRLTNLRKRIKTVTVLEKTTHAMRLTSISTHSRLQKKVPLLKAYNKALQDILRNLNKNEIEYKEDTSKELTIIVGSQKGLCGSFNNRIIKLLNKKNNNDNIILIGKKIIDLLSSSIKPLKTYPKFNQNNFEEISQDIINTIINNNHYSHITIYSNKPHTFFKQEAIKTSITIPKKLNNNDHQSESYYSYEGSKNQLELYVKKMVVKIQFKEILLESLIAEQSSRFISMDSATRNAEKLISNMKCNYNKLRQALITRELTDLSGSLL